MEEFVNELTKELFLNNPIFWSLIIIAILGFVFIKVKAKLFGNIGEWAVDKKLKNLPFDKYRILDNIMLEINGQTHQIDHIIGSKYGIFSIETKQYNGYITGSKYDKQWIRHLRRKKIYCLTKVI